ncbi:MAG: hypothetical protein ACP5RN_07105 [Armatimonadota bacterium]
MRWNRRYAERTSPLQGEGRQPLPQPLSCKEKEAVGSPFPRREAGQGVRFKPVLLLFLFITLTAFAQLPARRPLVVIFPEKVEAKKDQPDPNVGIATPLAQLLEETRRVDVLIYDSSAPYIQRLVQEGTLKAADVTAQPSAEQKRRIVHALGGQFALTVRAAWSEKPPMLPRPQKGKKIDPNLLQNLPTTSVIQVSAAWMPVEGGRTWQAQLESQPVLRALPRGGMTVDPVSTARTAASNLVTRLIAEPMAMLARVDVTQQKAQAAAPSGTSTPEDADTLMKQFLEEGQKYTRAGDLANAIEAYRKAADA